jgi:ubiquinone/menaquinone biosynthesis C-methylase UbiE
MADQSHHSQIREQFGRAAADYATSEIHAEGESLQILLQLTRPPANWRMLDVATGAGHTAHRFSRFVAEVMACDLTEAMLATAAAIARNRNIVNLRTQRADAEDLPFDDGFFDLLTCRLALHHFKRPQRALREFARVLRPTGILGLTDNVTVEEPVAAGFYNEFETFRDPSHQCVWSVPQLESMLAKAGFRIRAKRELSHEFEFHAWADRQRVDDHRKQQLLAMMRKIPDELKPLFRPRFDGGTMYFHLREAVIVGEKS